MHTLKYTAYLIVLIYCAHNTARAQPQKGIIWDPPDQSSLAIQEAIEMQELGVEAIRMDFHVDESLFLVMDSLGIDVYMDLDLAFVTTEMMADTLQWAKTRLSIVFELARRHTSLRNFGLLKEAHTTQKDFCTYLEQLQAFAKSRAPAGSSTYYSTRFGEKDACRLAVDKVLYMYNTLQDSVFVTLLSEREGIASIGMEVDDRVSGLANVASPEIQARRFEQFLTASQQNPSIAGSVFFISCWQDIISRETVLTTRKGNPYRLACGIQTLEGKKRPAYEVIRGFFKDEREVFAFERGKQHQGNHFIFILAGWFVLSLLVYAHARFQVFQSMMWRYFTAHGFYREAIRKGRERLLLPNSLIIIAFMLAFGISGTLLFGTLKLHIIFLVIIDWIPDPAGLTLYSLLSRPTVLFFLSMFIFIMYALIWTIVLTLFSGKEGHPLIPGQVLVLVVWPNWLVLLIMTASLLLPTMAPQTSTMLAFGIFGLVFLLASISISRTLRDYFAITRSKISTKLVVCLLNPFILATTVLLYVCIQNSDRIRYLWHLILYS